MQKTSSEPKHPSPKMQQQNSLDLGFHSYTLVVCIGHSLDTLTPPSVPRLNLLISWPGNPFKQLTGNVFTQIPNSKQPIQKQLITSQTLQQPTSTLQDCPHNFTKIPQHLQASWHDFTTWTATYRTTATSNFLLFIYYQFTTIPNELFTSWQPKEFYHHHWQWTGTPPIPSRLFKSCGLTVFW